jgi:hypothetical protein
LAAKPRLGFEQLRDFIKGTKEEEKKPVVAADPASKTPAPEEKKEDAK